MSRIERRHLETRDQILSDARLLVERDGAHNLSMRELAEKSEFTPPALYRYFPGGKEEVLEALAASSLELLAEHFKQVPADLPPDERLLELSLTYLEFAREHRQELDIMLVSIHALQICDSDEAHLLDPSGAFGLLLKALSEAAQAGVLKASAPGELMLIFHGLWSLIHGMAVLEEVHPHHEELFRTHARDLVRAYMNGFKTDWLKERS